MVQAIHGALLECDPSLKEFIRSVDEAQSSAEKFIISELGGKLFIKQEYLEMVQARVKDYQDAQHFEPATKKDMQ